MIPIDINDPNHKPEVIWGKYYYNKDKKLDIYHSYTRTHNSFQIQDVAVFWGIKKNKVQNLVKVDKTYELLVHSWLQFGWIKKERDFLSEVQYLPTPDGVKVAKEWKKNDKKEKYERRHKEDSRRSSLCHAKSRPSKFRTRWEESCNPSEE
jgi:hypothetical protein